MYFDPSDHVGNLRLSENLRNSEKMKKSKKIKKKFKILKKKSDKMKNLKTTQNCKKNMFFNFFSEKKKVHFLRIKVFEGSYFRLFWFFLCQISIVTFLFGSSRIGYRVGNIITAEETQITYIYEQFSENFIEKYFLEKISEYFIFCKKKKK